MCVNHAAYDGDDRLTMAVSVDQASYVLPNIPYHNNPGILYIQKRVLLCISPVYVCDFFAYASVDCSAHLLCTSPPLSSLVRRCLGDAGQRFANLAFAWSLCPLPFHMNWAIGPRADTGGAPRGEALFLSCGRAHLTIFPPCRNRVHGQQRGYDLLPRGPCGHAVRVSHAALGQPELLQQEQRCLPVPWRLHGCVETILACMPLCSFPCASEPALPGQAAPGKKKSEYALAEIQACLLTFLLPPRLSLCAAASQERKACASSPFRSGSATATVSPRRRPVSLCS